MFNYLARLGRNAQFTNFGQVVTFLVPTSFFSYHAFGHRITKELCSVRADDGGTVKMSPELKNIVMETFLEIKEKMSGLEKSVLGVRQEIQWFISGGHQPIISGMTRGSFGAIIGLPVRYNYTDPDKLPPSLFFIRYRSMFKKFFGQENDQEDQDTSQLCIQINKHSPAGSEYAKALILSDKAKRFSVARELFLSESWRYYGKTVAMSFCLLISFTLSRGFVMQYRLMGQHLRRRTPIYCMGGLFGYGLYCQFADLIDNLFTKQADIKAASLSPDFKQGAIEYYEGLININKIVRREDKHMERRIDENGNNIELLIRGSRLSFSDRLSYIKDVETAEA